MFVLIHGQTEAYSESPFLKSYLVVIAYVFFLELQNFGFYIEVFDHLLLIFVQNSRCGLLYLGFLLLWQSVTTKTNLGRNAFILPTLPYLCLSSKKSGQELTQGHNLRIGADAEPVDGCYLLTWLPLLSCRAEDHQPRAAPPTIGWVLPHQSLIMKRSHRLAHSPFYRGFYHFSLVTPVCVNARKLARTWSNLILYVDIQFSSSIHWKYSSPVRFLAFLSDSRWL